MQQAELSNGICQALGNANCGGQAPAAATAAAAPAPVAVNPAQVAEEAEAEIQLQAPALQLSPAANVNQIVNAPTWAWMAPADFTTLEATATAGPVSVTAYARPVSINITYADDGTDHAATCSGPGTPYSDQLAAEEDPLQPLSAASPTCGWTFHYATAAVPGGSDPVSADVTYAVTWTVVGAAGGGDLGTLASPAAHFDLHVDEIQVVNTNP